MPLTSHDPADRLAGKNRRLELERLTSPCYYVIVRRTVLTPVDYIYLLAEQRQIY